MNVMSEKVLVLNTSWTPVNVVTVFDAICKVFQERATIVDPETYMQYSFESWVQTWEDAKIEADRLIRTPSMTFKAPEVILCRDYHGVGTGKMLRRPKFSRRNIYLRDKMQCQYCGKRQSPENLNLDHVVPKSKGGRMDWLNIVLSCVSCNDKKRDMTPAQAGMRLIRSPRVPDAADLKCSRLDFLKKKVSRIPKTWEHFLGKSVDKAVSDMYWSVELE